MNKSQYETLRKFIQCLFVIGIGTIFCFGIRDFEEDIYNRLYNEVGVWNNVWGENNPPTHIIEQPISLEPGQNYSLVVRYRAESEAAISISSKGDDGIATSILDSKLPITPQGELGEQEFLFEVPDNEIKSFSLNADYGGDGVLFIDEVSIVNQVGNVSAHYSSDELTYNNGRIAYDNYEISYVPTITSGYSFEVDKPTEYTIVFQGVPERGAGYCAYYTDANGEHVYIANGTYYNMEQDGKIEIPITVDESIEIIIIAESREALPQAIKVNNGPHYAYLELIKKGAWIGTVIIMLLFVLLICLGKADHVWVLRAECLLSLAGVTWILLGRDEWYALLFLYFPMLMAIFSIVGANNVKKVSINEVSENRFLRILLSGSIAGIIGMTLFWAMLTSTEGSKLWQFNSANKANLKDYIIVVFVVVISFWIISQLLRLVSSQNAKMMVPESGVPIFVISTCLIAGFARNIFFIHHMARGIIVIILCLISGIYLLAKQGQLEWTRNVGDILTYLSYLVAIGNWYICLGMVNLYGTDGNTAYNSHHFSAYIQPIYDVAIKRPFQGGERDLYGHYALFFWLPMKVFGSSIKTFGICMGIVGVITGACFLYAIHKICKSRVARILGAIVVFTAPISSVIYYQTTPHRLIFPAIILAYAAAISSKKIQIPHIILGYVIVWLSLLWNTESGAVTGLAWLIYTAFRLGESEKRRFLKMLGSVIAGGIAIGIGERLVLYVVNLYNMIVTGYNEPAAWTTNQVLGGNSKWIYGIILVLILCVGVLGKLIFGKKNNAIRYLKILGVVIVVGLIIGVGVRLVLYVVKIFGMILTGFDKQAIQTADQVLGVLTNSGYMVSFHMTTLDWGNSKWVYDIILFLILFIGALGRLGIGEKNESDGRNAVLAVVGAQGLGLLTFFMNRTVAGDGIIAIYWGLTLVILFEMAYDIIFARNAKNGIIRCKQRESNYKTWFVASVGLIVYISLMGYVVNMGDQLDLEKTFRLTNRLYDAKGFNRILDDVRKKVPENTFSGTFEKNVNECTPIYMALGWDMKMNQFADEYVFSRGDLANEQCVLTDTFDFNGYTFGLYYNENYARLLHDENRGKTYDTIYRHSGLTEDGWMEPIARCAVRAGQQGKLYLVFQDLGNIDYAQCTINVNGKHVELFAIDAENSTVCVDIDPEEIAQVKISTNFYSETQPENSEIMYSGRVDIYTK